MASTPENTPPKTPLRRGLPLFPLSILILAISSVAYVRSLPEFERNLKSWLTAGIPLLAGILILIWFLLTKRFSGRTRLKGLAVVILLGLAWKAAVRVDGTVDGTGMPKWVWKWSTPQQPDLKALTPDRWRPCHRHRRQPAWPGPLCLPSGNRSPHLEIRRRPSQLRLAHSRNSGRQTTHPEQQRPRSHCLQSRRWLHPLRPHLGWRKIPQSLPTRHRGPFPPVYLSRLRHGLPTPRSQSLTRRQA